MALFRSLFPHPQQFCVHGVLYFLNPGETKEFPDIFRGRYGGLIEEVIPEEPKPPTTPETDEGPESEQDDIVSIVQKANAESIEAGKQSEVKIEQTKENTPVKEPKQKKNIKKKAGNKWPECNSQI